MSWRICWGQDRYRMVTRFRLFCARLLTACPYGCLRCMYCSHEALSVFIGYGCNGVICCVVSLLEWSGSSDVSLCPVNCSQGGQHMPQHVLQSHAPKYHFTGINAPSCSSGHVRC